MIRLREGLPPLPARMERLRIDARGYPVPWFVAWHDGKPDFRIVAGSKFMHAIRFGACWICGEPTGVKKTFVLGSLSTISRSTIEPASHYDCAHFAVRACPFMLLPRSQYRTADLPPGTRPASGHLTDRNPGVNALWTTSNYQLWGTEDGRMIQVGFPLAVEWYREGRRATRAEIMESIDSGMHYFFDVAAGEANRIEQLVQVENRYAQIQNWLPQ